MSNTLLIELRTKTLALRRILFEKDQALMNMEREKLVLDEMRAAKASSFAIKKQEEKVREQQMQATNTRLRCASAVEDLRHTMEIEPGMSHTPEYEAARSLLRETVQLYVY